MNCNNLFSGIFSILTLFVASSVGRKAIIGGAIAGVGQFRYLVSLQLDGRRTCSGGILDDKHILTAAHCVLSKYGNLRGSRMCILAGTNDLNNRTSPPAMTVEVVKIFVPTEFDPMSVHFSSDIAVLKLKHSLDLLRNSEHMISLKLPRNKHDDFDNRLANFAGFGWDWINVHGVAEEGGYSDGYLRWAVAKVINLKQCQSSHFDLRVTENHICARVKQYPNIRRGVCTGDSGGPLVYNREVIGVLSLSPGGCTERIKAAIYTRVSHYLDFIRLSMNDIPHDNIRSLQLHQ